MHATFYIENKPIIILSENATVLLAEKMKAIAHAEQLESSTLNNFLDALSLQASSATSFFDIDYFLEHNTQELKKLIGLLPKALVELQKNKPLKEEKIILSLHDKLEEYYKKLIS